MLGGLLFIVPCLLPVACCLLCDVSWLMFGDCWWLFVVTCVLVVVGCWMLFV